MKIVQQEKKKEVEEPEPEPEKQKGKNRAVKRYQRLEEKISKEREYYIEY